MRLTKLELHGFKSFADATEIQFHEGITAIVGPNGCGKSNISDAIRWVLGEQRPTAIRGAKMEEAIFQGTTQRRPLSRAEVALEFDNSDQRLAVPQKDVEIRRIVFREGGDLSRGPVTRVDAAGSQVAANAVLPVTVWTAASPSRRSRGRCPCGRAGTAPRSCAGPRCGSARRR